MPKKPSELSEAAKMNDSAMVQKGLSSIVGKEEKERGMEKRRAAMGWAEVDSSLSGYSWRFAP